MLRIRQKLTYILLSIVLRVAPGGTLTALSESYLRDQGYTILNPGATQATMSMVSFTRDRLRKLGGGNVSKLRDPRKSLMRAAANFERQLRKAQEGTIS